MRELERETEKANKLEIRQYLYYAIIFCISVVVLVFMPMVGSELDAGLKLPTTAAAWGVYVFTKLLTAVLNVLIYHCFIQQARVNASKNENYKKARDILNRETAKAKAKPKSEKEFLKKQYSSKAIMLFLTTIASTITLTQAILSYNYVTLLTYAVTIFMGIIFGVVEMKKVENYYCNEFYSYALMVEEENKTLCEGQNSPLETQKEQNNDNIRQQAIQEPGGASSQE